MRTSNERKDVITIVCATRFSKDAFWQQSMLGKSLMKLATTLDGVRVNVFFENKEGLSTVYNRVIRSCIGNPSILIFVHDDVFIYDIMFIDRIREAMKQCDIAGLAGTSVRYPKQPCWYYREYDDETQEFALTEHDVIHGTVAHGDAADFKVSYFGPLSNNVKLLDGLMLIAHSSRLTDHNVYFDEQFAFDFYDMDFCREAEAKGLTMAVIGLSAIHASIGIYNTSTWRQAYQLYVQKWEK
jgi:GT2 family glycosyltransferase